MTTKNSGSSKWAQRTKTYFYKQQAAYLT